MRKGPGTGAVGEQAYALLTEEEGVAVSEAINRELGRAWVEEIFNAEDLDACDRLIADEYVEHALATFGRSEPGRVPGPATMRQTAQFIIGQFPDVSMTVESIIAEGMRWRYE